MQMSIGLDRLKRFVCLLLIFVLLFCFFMCPRASAVALEATTIAYGGLLVGTILVGAGVVFSSHGDMVKVGNAMYKTLVNGSSAIGKTISSISAWAVEHGTALAKGALRVGKDMYQAIVDAFNAAYSNGSFSFAGTLQSFDSYEDAYKYIANNFAFGAPIHLYCKVYDDSYGGLLSYHFYTRCRVEGNSFVLESGHARVNTGIAVNVSKNALIGVPVSSYYESDDYYGSYKFYVRFLMSDGQIDGYNISLFDDLRTTGLGGPFVVSADDIYCPVQGDDLKYPSDDYLVRMPDIPSVDTATGDVTYPNDTAFTKDAVAVPYPVDVEGVKVPDIPFDIPVDQTSGKPMDDTGTDTDNPSKPGEGTDTDKPSVNWPSAGDISLPKLIISKFPFCIPFDVARLIGLLEADPKTPIFHVPLKVGTILDEEIVLDLSQWDNAVRIIRWGELIVFVAGLVLVTRNCIKW